MSAILNLKEAKNLICEVEFALWSLERKFGVVSERQEKRQAVEDVLYYLDFYKDSDIEYAVSVWYREVENEIEEGFDEPNRESLNHEILGLLRVV